MDAKLILALFLLTWTPSVFSENSDQAMENLLKGLGNLVSKAASETPGGGGNGGPDTVPCLQKLMPCQPFLHSPSPPATCCVPLKQMIASDADCLCTVFNNADLLKSMNLTQSQAMDLPKNCGAQADISVCKKGASPPSATPSPPAGSSDKPSTSTPTSAGGRIVAAGTSFASFLVVIVSVFIVYVV